MESSVVLSDLHLAEEQIYLPPLVCIFKKKQISACSVVLVVVWFLKAGINKERINI